MKLKNILACLCGGILSLSAAACNTGKSTQLAKPITVKALSYQERIEEDLLLFEKQANEFSSNLSQAVLDSFPTDKNFTVSPISVFFALALASECTSGETREELLSALGVSYEQLTENISKLYRLLEKKYASEGFLGTEKVTSQLSLSNSIWIDNQVTAKKECLDVLSKEYYCYAYKTDFFADNASANQAIRDFVKKQTNKKIDQNFNLPKETLFALINTLYIKDTWNETGKNLSKTAPYEFKNADGNTLSKELLTGYYKFGRAYKTESYSTFYTTTYHGYKIQFILPNDGYTAKDVFTAETLDEINNITDYNGLDEENLIEYQTRCLFPEYKTEFYNDLKTPLMQSFDIQNFFDERCDFTPLTDADVVCGRIIHSAKLDVMAKGIEGAAVTVTGMKDTSVGGSEYQVVYEDFIVNKAFAFTLSSPENVTLFSGIVNKV